MNVRTMATNGLIAAVYIAVTAFIQPFGFTNIQFRVSEMLNHLVVFRRTYAVGIVLGVFLANLFFSPIVAYDLVFGVGQSVLALLITIVSMRYVENIWARMAINTLSFTVTMAIIAFELKLALGFPFWLTWLTTAIGEFVVMAIGAPIMYAVGRRIAPEAFRAADGRND
ncbi:QueT transporter family protein [Geobacillus sp. FSL K6-0789]|uniref:QueT transporter family protein n=1 Tax=Geobacillus stearothermophilus TaxID=1422 RepID=A0A0K9HEI0_GEOSE|nr:MULTISPECIES: QueT transporter family protein [Geobacillus]KAF6511579.1 Substrate-specific component QueT of predicted queuosine-regulated ECF transporter [Geobacillus stearothermophilus]KMY57181.1 membrane protein [Geobacillus stearothermophilus]KMY57233.1 membrane protein [Geobacillus stearothermophilus]KMY61197.1 membrane protein [Geobacillus stearothermophilus]KOR94605.1 membrane protein [Geobacillus stearothermophilus ATCC 12980]